MFAVEHIEGTITSPYWQSPSPVDVYRTIPANLHITIGSNSMTMKGDGYDSTFAYDPANVIAPARMKLVSRSPMRHFTYCTPAACNNAIPSCTTDDARRVTIPSILGTSPILELSHSSSCPVVLQASIHVTLPEVQSPSPGLQPECVVTTMSCGTLNLTIK